VEDILALHIKIHECYTYKCVNNIQGIV